VHNGIWANEEADKLAKKGLLEEPIQFNDRLITSKFMPTWYNMTIENNSRTFVKTLYQIRNEELADNLKRIKRFEDANKRISYKILNRRIDQENKSNHETFKDARFKNFRFKLMINELPVLEKLKIRYMTKNLNVLDVIESGKLYIICGNVIRKLII